jgi:hypothetical protein
MKTSLKAIAFMAALAVLMTIQSAVAQARLEGVWKITEVTLSRPNGEKITAPQAQPNLIIFTKRYYSLVSVAADKPRPDLALDALLLQIPASPAFRSRCGSWVCAP